MEELQEKINNKEPETAKSAGTEDPVGDVPHGGVLRLRRVNASMRKGITDIQLFVRLLVAVFMCVLIVTAVLFADIDTSDVVAAPADNVEPSAHGGQTITPAPTDTPDVTWAPVRYIKTSILIDGKVVAVLASREAAESVIDDVLEHYTLITQSDVAHTVILNDLEFADADEDDEIKSREGASMMLKAGETPLKVESRSEQITTTLVPYDTKYIDDPNLLKGMRIYESFGHEGTIQHRESLVYINGVLYRSEISSEETLIERVDEVIRMGTLEPKAGEPGEYEGEHDISQGDLVFIQPVSGEIVLNFGRYNMGFHMGLDYEAEAGTSVVASSGGVCICATERGGYGLVVEIDHGNGFTTRYAHLNEISVSVGDEVQAGAVIGTVGNTGNCDTPHLHFELRISGRAYNPRYYLD